MSVDKTIKDRDSKYGAYADYAKTCYQLKFVSDHSKHHKDFCHIHTEALDMIFCKIARILNGDPNLIDNWHDIAGYARLVEIELEKEE